MEHHHLPLQTYTDKVLKLNQAIFYCYNASSERVAVGMIKDFTFRDNTSLCFTTKYFPVTEMNWNSFAGELYFYNKDTHEKFVLHGIAVVEHQHTNTVMFTVISSEGDMAEDNATLLSTLYKSYLALYKKSSELLMLPFRRKTTTQIFQ